MKENAPQQALRHKVLEILDHTEISATDAADMSLLGEEGGRILMEIANGTLQTSRYQRGNAVYLLGLLKNDRHEHCLLSVLTKSEEDRLKILAIRALGKTATRNAAQALAHLIKSGKSTLPQVQSAIATLGDIGGAEELKLLENYHTGHIDPLIRCSIESAMISIRQRIRG
ncbi:hypothetical protein AQUSIP_17120 [Aquicella siphonis]|uniref:HEAT repeat domain-containing protein n=1 Tax=Aquicella siphonis TaxID=254247 RepID=A0A5E4PH97_9COXI|nr:HEAT repeat domain-containing protein [Aquicella siphonis]VVC76400.1 hypothetical protein AQUSIP_17120 [Aquicella siphonis]